jgi:phytanoyl-CoA hydroxylase
MLTADQLDSYHRDGFLVIEDFVDRRRCEALVDRAAELVDAWDPGQARTVFTTDEQERTSDEYFLSSGDAIRFFWEEHAFGPDGELAVPKDRALNKLGHALHDLDPVFSAFSRTPELAALAADLGLADPLLLQSMYIFKQPFIGGEVGCHQDATFLSTDPVTVTGFWFALQDATTENGCLWAAPGGHRTPLRKLFKRNGGDRDGTRFEVLDPTPLPDPREPGALVPLEAPAGTLVVLHGTLPHWSDENRSGTSRHAYTLHCISAGAEYPAWNWLQRRSVPLRGFSG